MGGGRASSAGRPARRDGFRDALWPDARRSRCSTPHRRRADVPDQRRRAQRVAEHAPRCAARALDPTGRHAARGGRPSRSRVASTPSDPRSRDALVRAMAADAASRGRRRGSSISTWRGTRRLGAPARGGLRRAARRVRRVPASPRRAIAEGLRTGRPRRGDGIRPRPRRPAQGHHRRFARHPHRVRARTRIPATGQPRGAHGRRRTSWSSCMTTATGGGARAADARDRRRARTRHALDAFALTGAAGTIEHAQLVAHADVPRFARLGVGASVQPEHAMDDRDVADRYWAGRTDRGLSRSARSLDAGANLRFGSDAPVAPLDPWVAMAAAVFRTRDGREPGIRSRRSTSARRSRRRRAPAAPRRPAGQLADLVVVDRDPLTAAGASCDAMPVAATLLAGRFTHAADAARRTTKAAGPRDRVLRVETATSRDVREEEPAVLLEAARDLDRDVLARRGRSRRARRSRPSRRRARRPCRRSRRGSCPPTA